MQITVVPTPPKVAVKDEWIIKVLMNTHRKGTFYVSGGGLLLSSKRSAADIMTKDDAYAFIKAHGLRPALNQSGVLMTVVRRVETRGEHGRRD